MAGEVAISAADLEKYGYCPLNWWLAHRGVKGGQDALEEGQREHRRVAAKLEVIQEGERKAKEDETLVLHFAVASTLLAFLGLTVLQPWPATLGQVLAMVALIWILAGVYYLYRADVVTSPGERLLSERVAVGSAIAGTAAALFAVSSTYIMDTTLGVVLEVVALVWLVGASYFLYRSLSALQVASATREKEGVGEGAVEYLDPGGSKGRLLTSRRYGLTGRPDYILGRNGEHVPVEVKTGRVPRGPLFSHILQVAAYCLLLEEEHGRPPPYGLLRYGKVEHEIEFTDELRSLLLQKLQEMRTAASTGNVHRNHNRPGKCLGCSRRHACPERLA